jgi:hypothetical protein
MEAYDSGGQCGSPKTENRNRAVWRLLVLVGCIESLQFCHWLDCRPFKRCVAFRLLRAFVFLWPAKQARRRRMDSVNLLLIFKTAAVPQSQLHKVRV